jgi:hypothetical protein
MMNRSQKNERIDKKLIVGASELAREADTNLG